LSCWIMASTDNSTINSEGAALTDQPMSDDSLDRDYCRLWRALVIGKKDDIEKYCREMNAGDLYPLLSAMLTLRPWDDIISNDDVNRSVPTPCSSLIAALSVSLSLSLSLSPCICVFEDYKIKEQRSSPSECDSMLSDI
jgi:hypothetical protein